MLKNYTNCAIEILEVEGRTVTFILQSIEDGVTWTDDGDTYEAQVESFAEQFQNDILEAEEGDELEVEIDDGWLEANGCK